MTYLLDTNVLSETRKRHRNHGVTEWISGTSPEKLHLAVLTIGEFDSGINALRAGVTSIRPPYSGVGWRT